MDIINANLKFRTALTNRKNTTAIILHHADANGQTVETIHNYHINNNSYIGIGYNFYIRKDGKIYQGRGWEAIGAHAGSNSGYNSKSLGICFEGRYDSTDTKMPDAQYNAGLWLIKEAFRKFGKLNILKHSDVTKTACPGRYFPFDKMVAELSSGGKGAITPDTPVRASDPATVRKGSKGDTVKKLQRELNRVNKSDAKFVALVVDGDFGPKTEATVMAFQLKNKLEVDGICGPKTWKKLLES